MKCTISMPTLISLYDEKAGHNNAVKAVEQMLNAQYHFPTFSIHTTPLKKWVISLSKKLLSFPKIIHYLLTPYLYNTIITPILEYSQQYQSTHFIILCSGMNNVIIAHYAKSYIQQIQPQIKIHVHYFGALRGLDSANLDLVANTLDSTQSNHVKLPTPPVRHHFIETRYKPFIAQKVLLILGGATQNYPFIEQDWLHILTGIHTYAQKYHLSVDVITSRRTPLSTHEIQQSIQQLQLNCINQVYDNTTSLAELIADYELLFVTEDSVSMVSETINTGRSVITLYPQNTTTEPLILEYAHQNWLTRCSVQEISNMNYPITINQQNLPDYRQIILNFIKNHVGTI